MILFVTVDSIFLTTQDEAKRDLFIDWGYTVVFLTSNATQTVYDNAINTLPPNSVVFVSEEVSSGDVNMKLVEKDIGIVMEESSLADDFGMTDDPNVTSVATKFVTIIDASHYITQDLIAGDVQVFNSSALLNYYPGTMASGVQILGLNKGNNYPALLAVEKGASMLSVAPPPSPVLTDEATLRALIAAPVYMPPVYMPAMVAANRRAIFPWGQPDTSFNNLTPDGRLLLRRSIEWCSGFDLVVPEPT